MHWAPEDGRQVRSTCTHNMAAGQLNRSVLSVFYQSASSAGVLNVIQVKGGDL